MAPFLRDEGPPVSKDTIQRARESLPIEFGYQTVNETGREVLLVRVPKAKPDYLHDLGDVAFYVNLDMIRNCKDVLLIGHEKTARVEPQLLRDNIRAQDREDEGLVSDLRRRLGRDYAATIIQSPSNFQHQALAVRIPKSDISSFSPDDVKAIRDVVQQQGARLQQCQYAYILADRDHERLGRRMLLELLGQPAPTPASQQPLAPAAAPAAASADPAAPLAARFALPLTPGAAPPPPAPVADAATGALPGFLAAKTHSVAVAAVPAPAPPPPPAPVPAATSPPTPAPAAIAAPVEIVEKEEYSIISKPKAPPPQAPAPSPAVAPAPTADITSEPEYEITSKPKPASEPAAAAAAKPMVEDHPEVERSVSVATEAYEVYTSKPKTPKASGPAITPPGHGGFQAALDAATAFSGHAPAKTKEYEIMGASKPPAAASSPVASMLSHASAAPAGPTAVAAPPPRPAPAPPVDEPRALPAIFSARQPAAPVPNADNGATIVPKVQTIAPELALAQRFKESGYEVVESLRAQGTVFAFAAHKTGGRRVLVKRQPEFGADEAATLAQLVAALGADICLVVADKVQPGTRLATWGTRIEAMTPSEASALAF